MSNNYTSCDNCKERRECGLSQPSKPSFGCFAGEYDSKADSTWVYLRGDIYHPMYDGPREKTERLMQMYPFIGIPGIGYLPTFVLPKEATI